MLLSGDCMTWADLSVLSILHLTGLLPCLRPLPFEKGKIVHVWKRRKQRLQKDQSLSLSFSLQAEESLRRLRQPLHLRLPIQEISDKDWLCFCVYWRCPFKAETNINLLHSTWVFLTTKVLKVAINSFKNYLVTWWFGFVLLDLFFFFFPKPYEETAEAKFFKIFVKSH